MLSFSFHTSFYLNVTYYLIFKVLLDAMQINLATLASSTFKDRQSVYYNAHSKCLSYRNSASVKSRLLILWFYQKTVYIFCFNLVSNRTLPTVIWTNTNHPLKVIMLYTIINIQVCFFLRLSFKLFDLEHLHC